jgi:beta-barrel assembly-enhancing protease
MRNPMWRRRRLPFTVVIAILIGLTGRSASALSRDEEIRLGQQSAAQIERRYRTGESATVSRIGRSLAAVSDAPGYPYRFRVIDMEQANAFALPGGPVYVTDALLNMVGGDQSQLAGVLGHEIAHITERHASKQIERENWLGLGLQILTRGSARDVAAIAANLTQLRYSRNQEREADSRGVAYLRRAGYDPMGLVRFLERLSRMERGGASLPFLRSHPGSQARADRLRRMLVGRRG